VVTPRSLCRLAERRRCEFDLGQSEPRSLGGQSADPPRRRALVPLRVVAIKQAQLQRVGAADVLEVARGGLGARSRSS
jgi:hypothetical protein